MAREKIKPERLELKIGATLRDNPEDTVEITCVDNIEYAYLKRFFIGKNYEVMGQINVPLEDELRFGYVYM